MSGQVAMHEANITITGTGPMYGDTTVHEKHQVNVRQGRATIRTRGGSLVRERGGVVSAKRDPNDGAWVVTFTDDEQWRILAVVKKCGACS